MRRSNARTVNPSSDCKKVMDPIKLQFRSARPGLRTPNGKFLKPRSKFCFYISITVSLFLFCCIMFSGNRKQEYRRYGVVIDGGSTGTRIHVLKYEIRNGNLVFDFSNKGSVSMRVNPGFSAYVEEPESAGSAVAKLVEFAQRNVPKEQWGETEVRLMATAGMRLLKSEDQERILSVCRRVLQTSGFRFQDHWATVISGNIMRNYGSLQVDRHLSAAWAVIFTLYSSSLTFFVIVALTGLALVGSDEGLYAWVVANYALGSLGGEPAQTTGIIELGGASAQVTFVSDEPMPAEFSRNIKFGNFTYNLYSHSFLQFGQNVAFELLKESLVSGGQEMVTASVERGKPMDPCTPTGYTHDTEAWKLSPDAFLEKNTYLSTLFPRGNYSECRSASIKLLQKGREKCSYKTCQIGLAFIPKLKGKFLATENFFHTSKFFGLKQRTFLSELVVAGQQFCNEDWSKLKQKYKSHDEEELLRYCFSSAYIVALLNDSFGIDLNDHRIVSAAQVQSIPLDWALGAFILHASADSTREYSKWFSSIMGGQSSAPIILFGVLFLLIFAMWIVSKWRKPQLKTIYDLEKGKYIVTRVNRYS